MSINNFYQSTIPYINNYYWDAVGGSFATGGTGTWDLTSPLWHAQNDGGYRTIFPYKPIGITPIFSGNNGVVTTSGTQIFNNMNFLTSGYTIAGSLNMVGLSKISVISGGNATITATISGPQSILQTDPSHYGNLILSNNNTYSGGTIIDNGSIQTNTISGFGLGSVTVNTSGIAILNLSNVTVSNNFVGSGTINCSGLGAGSTGLALNGNMSNFTGTINIGPSGGKVAFVHTNSSNYSNISSINLYSGAIAYFQNLSILPSNFNLYGGTIGEALGQMRIESGTVINGPVTLYGNSSIGSNVGNGYITNIISENGGSYNLTKLGSGNIILSNANTYSGLTTVSGGTLTLGNGTNAGSVVNNINVSSGTTLGINLPSNGLINNPISNTGTISCENNLPNIISSNISGIGTFQKNTGIGSVTLTGINTYTGTTTIKCGVININGTNSGGNTISVGTVATSSAILNISGSVTALNLLLGNNATGPGACYVNNGNLTLTKASGTDNLQLGSVNNAYGFLGINSANSLVTTNELGIGGGAGANSVGVCAVYGGTSIIKSAGYITIGRGSGTSSGMLDIYNGNVACVRCELNWAATTSPAYSFVNVENGVLSISGSSTLGLNLSIANIAGNTNIANINSNGILSTGIITATTANPTNILNFNGGTIRATPTNAGASFLTSGNVDSTFIHRNGLTIDDNGTNITISRPLLTNNGAGLTSVSISTSGRGYIGIPIAVVAGGTGTPATCVCRMADDGMGQGTYQIGSLYITNPGVYTAPPTGITFIGGGGKVTAVATSLITGANVTTGIVTKIGSGTLTLSGVSTYTGTTNISAGTLLLTGTLASSVNINGGTLLGTGTVSNAVTVSNTTSSIIQGGTGAGTATTLNVGNLTFNGSTSALNVTSNGTTAPSLVASTGTVTLGGATVNLLGALNAGTYNLITASSMSGTVVVGTNSTGRSVSSCQVSGNNLVLVLV